MRRTVTRLTRPLAAVVLLLSSPPASLLAARRPAPPPLPPRGERLARLAALEDARSSGEGALAALLRDADRGVRRRAALAAGRIGDRALVPPLVELLGDPEVEVRRMAAFALGLLGDGAASERLLAALADPDGSVRGRAAEALGRIGEPRAAAAIARLIVDRLPKTISRMAVRGDDPGNPGDGWSEQRLELVALAALKDRAAAQSALLAEGRPRFDWWLATWVALRLEDPALRPVLVAALASDDPRSRSLGARGLGVLKDPSAVELLLPLVRDADESVALQALRALGAIADARGTAAAAGLLASPSVVLRREALRALAVLPADPTLRPRLVALVAERDPWLRAAAFGALARTSPDDFALVLSGLDRDPEPQVRAALAAALGTVGNEMSVGVLHAMLADDEPRVVAAVLEALRRARGADSLDTLRRHLEHADLGVRVAAAEQIAALGAKDVSPVLAAAWQRGLADGGELEARLAAVVALGQQKDEPARAALARVAAEDPVRAVRARASAALAALGAPAPDPGPQAVQRPALDYRDAVAPYDPRPGTTLYSPRAFLHTRRGRVEILLDVVDAPLTVASFVALAKRGFYDGLALHRVEPGFVVQGGCPRGDGNGGPGYTLRCENNPRSYARGSVGMALSGKDTGGSQFFITLAPQPQLDASYTLFGSVASGMDVVDRLQPGDVIERVEVWTGE